MNDAPDDDRTASLMTPAKLVQLQTRPRPQATPAAWLDQLASDAGSGHVRRLLELRQQLQPLAGGCGEEDVASALAALAQALEGVDFGLLQPRGWLARATGRGKADGASFAAQAQRAERAGEDLADEVRALQKKQAAQASPLERTLLEVEVELRAIEKIMDQGARWLQDMRGTLRAGEKQDGDAPAQEPPADGAARCELLVARLKQLRAATSAVRAQVDQGRAAIQGRAALADSVRGVLETPWSAWQQRVAPLAAAATAASADAVERARAVQHELLVALRAAGEECASVAEREQAFAQSVAALQAPLQAAS